MKTSIDEWVPQREVAEKLHTSVSTIKRRRDDLVKYGIPLKDLVLIDGRKIYINKYNWMPALKKLQRLKFEEKYGFKPNE